MAVWTPIRWYGGKTAFVKKILYHFPVNYFDRTYVEVFGGGGSVLTAKHPSTVEGYNDINTELTNFLEVIRTQDGLMDFLDHFTGSFDSKSLYLHYMKPDNKLTSVERAWRFYYVCEYAYSGIPTYWHGVYGLSRKQPALPPDKFTTPSNENWKPFNTRVLTEKFAELRKFSQRWRRVSISCNDFRDVVSKYDSPDVLFYFDPPYFDGGFKYAEFTGYPDDLEPFSIDDHRELAEIMKSTEGLFILSIDDHPLTEEIYMDPSFTRVDFETRYCSRVNTEDVKKPPGKETLIYNYKNIMRNRVY